MEEEMKLNSIDEAEAQIKAGGFISVIEDDRREK